MKKVAIFGSTGSVGRSTIEVIRHLKSEFKISALAAGTNYQRLVKQVIETKPKFVITSDVKTKEKLHKLLTKVNAGKITILTGEHGLSQVAIDDEIDILVMAMSGTKGIIPLIKAIEEKKRIALSTKELLVSFGSIIMQKANQYDAEIIPIDSELAGLHQCLSGRNPDEVKKLIITASGGPFFKRKNMSNISISEALKHPVWKMGKKITVDSATLANKGLEVIETSRLFSIPPEKIEVLIHPQSIIHALVEFNDNSTLAQLSLPDMRLCIQYALTFPKRVKSLVQSLDLSKQKKLEFYSPHQNQFPALKLAYQALKTDGTAPCIFNAANEVAVGYFLAGKISFNMIPKIIDRTLKALPLINNPTLLDLLKYEERALKYAERII
jgi:1-deoxy-D-xylulose-5-phosphate reductoisomerase